MLAAGACPDPNEQDIPFDLKCCTQILKGCILPRRMRFPLFQWDLDSGISMHKLGCVLYLGWVQHKHG